MIMHQISLIDRQRQAICLHKSGCGNRSLMYFLLIVVFSCTALDVFRYVVFFSFISWQSFTKTNLSGLVFPSYLCIEIKYNWNMFLVFYQIQKRFQGEQINKTELMDNYYSARSNLCRYKPQFPWLFKFLLVAIVIIINIARHLC